MEQSPLACCLWVSWNFRLPGPERHLNVQVLSVAAKTCVKGYPDSICSRVQVGSKCKRESLGHPCSAALWSDRGEVDLYCSLRRSTAMTEVLG